MPSNKKRSVSAGTTAAPTAASKGSTTTRATYTQEFNPDYSVIKHDLRRIGIMAGSFLVVLVALSFFLR